jgi:hypothetical protein
VWQDVGIPLAQAHVHAWDSADRAGRLMDLYWLWFFVPLILMVILGDWSWSVGVRTSGDRYYGFGIAKAGAHIEVRTGKAAADQGRSSAT